MSYIPHSRNMLYSTRGIYYNIIGTRKMDAPLALPCVRVLCVLSRGAGAHAIQTPHTVLNPGVQGSFATVGNLRNALFIT